LAVVQPREEQQNPDQLDAGRSGWGGVGRAFVDDDEQSAMSVTEPKPVESKPKHRWFHLTPGRFILLLLLVECLLWLSERFGWLPWHKGYAVLTAVASVGVAMLLILVWFAVALIFRWQFQFNLRSMLLLVVVVAVPCSWLAVEMKAAREQADLVAAIKKLGNVCYDCDPRSIVSQVREPQGPRLLRGRLGRDFFDDVREVEVHRPVQNQLFAATANLTKLEPWTMLEVLDIHETIVSDAEMVRVARHGQLKSLRLDGTGIADAGMVHLAGLTNLRELDLTYTNITDASMAQISRFVRLQDLRLTSTRITDAAVMHIANLKELRLLDLGGTKVTDAGLAKLQQALPHCKITY
jgi:hypothetical protein